jgi:hypothetical protein
MSSGRIMCKDEMPTYTSTPLRFLPSGKTGIIKKRI